MKLRRQESVESSDVTEDLSSLGSFNIGGRINQTFSSDTSSIQLSPQAQAAKAAKEAMESVMKRPVGSSDVTEDLSSLGSFNIGGRINQTFSSDTSSIQLSPQAQAAKAAKEAMESVMKRPVGSSDVTEYLPSLESLGARRGFNQTFSSDTSDIQSNTHVRATQGPQKDNTKAISNLFDKLSPDFKENLIEVSNVLKVLNQREGQYNWLNLKDHWVKQSNKDLESQDTIILKKNLALLTLMEKLGFEYDKINQINIGAEVQTPVSPTTYRRSEDQTSSYVPVAGTKRNSVKTR